MIHNVKVWKRTPRRIEIFIDKIEQLFNSMDPLPFVMMATVALTSLLFRADAATLRAGEFAWNPEFSASSPLVIINLGDRTLSAYRIGVRIGRSSTQLCHREEAERLFSQIT